MSNGATTLFGLFLLLAVTLVQAAPDVWQDVTFNQRALGNAEPAIRYYEADYQALLSLLAQVPHENTGDRSRQIELPMPDGRLALFSVAESPIITPDEAALLPQIKTFKVFGIDDRHAYGRISLTTLGFHGMLQTSKGRVFIDPQETSSQNNLYLSRFNDALPSRQFSCGVQASAHKTDPLANSSRGYANRTEGNLLEYNFAVATTLEYFNIEGNVMDTASKIAATVNRVNMIYERDFGIKLILVGITGEIYEQTESGLLDNENVDALLAAVSNWIDTRLPTGNAGYDIGHMFSRPMGTGGGKAFLGVVCDNAFKARGVTGLPNPSGDIFDIDFVAHEIGHQFNANHSFNGTSSACINRNPATAYEPGSGSSIMGYAGICPGENLQNFSEPTFHAGSIIEVDTYAWSGAGLACATQVANGNTDPTIMTPIADRTIPINTPFILDNTTAVDTDIGDTLSYQWDQLNAGTATNSATFGTDLGDNALFRSYEPRTVSFRNFPALSTQLNNEFDDSEVLPCTARTIDLRLTVRDDSSGQVTDDVVITTDAGSGPFRVTSQATAANIIPNSGAVKVDWEVANTTSAPVSCPNVVIELLTFEDATKNLYSVQPMVVGGFTANDGSEQVTLPDISNSVSRIRVRCSNNIFYDISDADLDIQGTTAITTYDIPVALANPLTSDNTAPDCAIVNTGGGSSGSGSGSRDASAFGFIWLLLLAGLSVVRHWLPSPLGAGRESLR